MNKKGLLNEIWIIIILFIVLLVIIGGFWIVATVGPLVTGLGKQVTGTIQTGVHENDNGGHLENATIVAVTMTNNMLGIVESIVYLMFIGIMIGYLAVCYYVRSAKWLSFVWILLMIAVVFICYIVSTAYQQAYAGSSDMLSFYQTWGTNHFIMTYLPYIAGIFGILSGIILFVIISTDSEEEGKIIE